MREAAERRAKKNAVGRGIKHELLADEVLAEVVGRVAREMAKPAKPTSGHPLPIAEFCSEISNLTEAIAGALLRPSIHSQRVPTARVWLWGRSPEISNRRRHPDTLGA